MWKTVLALLLFGVLPLTRVWADSGDTNALPEPKAELQEKSAEPQIASPAKPTAEQAAREASFRERMEWFSARALGSNYGGGFEASFFTFRWNYVVWELMRTGFSAGGHGFSQKRLLKEYGKPIGRKAWLDALAAYGGTAIGARIPLRPERVGSDPRHELRLETGLFAGQMELSESLEIYDTGAIYSSFGPFVLLEANYVYTIVNHVKLEVGLELLVPAAKHDTDNGFMKIYHTLLGYPEPLFGAFVGMRF